MSGSLAALGRKAPQPRDLSQERRRGSVIHLSNHVPN